MKTFFQKLNPPANLLGFVLLLLPAVCLAATAEQSQQLLPSIVPVAQADQEIALAGCDSACCDDSTNRHCGGGACELACCPKLVKEEVKKHSWLVEPKYVCIPGFRWPWQQSRSKNPDCGDGCGNSCNTPVCGRVRCVNTLEKHEYKCEKCGYHWEVKCVRPSNQSRKSRKCDCPSCGRKSSCDS